MEKTANEEEYVIKDESEMKKLCNFGFHEKDGSPHVCKVNCECEFATFGICNEDGSYGYGYEYGL